MASSRPSRRHWKMKGSSRDIAGLKVSSAAERASRIELKLRHRARKEAQREQDKENCADQPLVVRHVQMPVEVDVMRKYGSLPRRKASDAGSTFRQRGSSMDRMLGQTNANQIQVAAVVHQPVYQPNTAFPPPLPPPRSVSHSVGLDTVRHSTDINQNFPIYTSQQQQQPQKRCPSPERVMTRYHSKGETGSNPDSGYGSRIYGFDPKTGRVTGSTGSSFQSCSSPDPQNTSHNTSNGSSPGFYYTDHLRFRQPPLHTSPASPPSMPASVRDWFNRQPDSPAPQIAPTPTQLYCTSSSTAPSVRLSSNVMANASQPRKDSGVEIGKATQV
jgi:hypothetical protein